MRKRINKTDVKSKITNSDEYKKVNEKYIITHGFLALLGIAAAFAFLYWWHKNV